MNDIRLKLKRRKSFLSSLFLFIFPQALPSLKNNVKSIVHLRNLYFRSKYGKRCLLLYS